MSEIACFEEQIIIKVNDLLKHKKLKLSVIGIKLVFTPTWYLKMFNLNQ